MILENGDCLDLLQHLPENSIDFVCADLPYGTTKCSWDSVIPLEPLWIQLKRVAKDNAPIALFAQTPFDKILGCSNLPMLRYEWIWEKTNATGFFNAKKMPLKAHENVLVFYKKLPVYNPQKTTGHPRKTAGRKEIGSEIYGKGVKKTHYDSTERYPRSVLKFQSDRYKQNLHPTQKPESLLEYMIMTYSNEGDVVLDFCMGSGTTGVAAERLNREFIGFEKDRNFFSVAVNRIGEARRELRKSSENFQNKDATARSVVE